MCLFICILYIYTYTHIYIHKVLYAIAHIYSLQEIYNNLNDYIVGGETQPTPGNEAQTGMSLFIFIQESVLFKFPCNESQVSSLI